LDPSKFKVKFSEYEYYNKVSKSPQNFNVNNTKDTPSEIKLKYDFLSKYEIYLKNNNENAKNFIKVFIF